MKTITKAGAFILAGVLLLTAGCGNNEVETQQSPLVKTITVGEKDSEMTPLFPVPSMDIMNLHWHFRLAVRLPIDMYRLGTGSERDSRCSASTPGTQWIRWMPQEVQ